MCVIVYFVLVLISIRLQLNIKYWILQYIVQNIQKVKILRSRLSKKTQRCNIHREYKAHKWHIFVYSAYKLSSQKKQCKRKPECYVNKIKYRVTCKKSVDQKIVMLLNIYIIKINSG